MKTIKFLGKEYNVNTFENEVNVYDLSDEELEEFQNLLPKREYFFTGGSTWNGDDMHYPNMDSRIVDLRYLEDEDIECVEEINAARRLAR